MYKARPYLLFDTQEGTILQNNIATVLLKNDKIINFLRNLETNKSLLQSEEKIRVHFPNNYTEAINFMLANSIISQDKFPVFKFDDIHIISNSQVFSDFFASLSKDVCENVNFYDIISYDTELGFLSDKSLCVVFLNPFDLREYIKLNDEIAKHDCIVKFIFYYGHNIYISNYHKPSWKNPCPKCFFYSLEAQLRGDQKGGGSINFQTLIDIFYIRDVRFNSEATLKAHHLLGVMKALFDQFAETHKINSFVNIVHELTLESSYVNTDYAYHWEMCDCHD